MFISVEFPKIQQKNLPELLSIYNKFAWYRVSIEKSVAHSSNKGLEFEILKHNLIYIRSENN